MERDVRYPSNFHSKHEDKPWDFWAPYLQTNPFLVCSMSCLELQSDKLRLFGCDETGQLTEEGESLRDHIKLNHSFDSCFIAISVPFHTISCEFLMNYWRSKRESPFNSCWFAGRDLINYHRFLRLWRPRWHWWPWWPWERSGLGVWLLCASHIDTWVIHSYPSFVIFWWAFVIIQCFRRILWSHSPEDGCKHVELQIRSSERCLEEARGRPHCDSAYLGIRSAAVHDRTVPLQLWWTSRIFSCLASKIWSTFDVFWDNKSDVVLWFTNVYEAYYGYINPIC
jgi:hypothetical protein